MGCSSSRYNFRNEQINLNRLERRRSTFSESTGKSNKSSRSSSQPSITVRSPTIDGGLEEIIYVPRETGWKRIISKTTKLVAITFCIVPPDSPDSPPSPKRAGSFQLEAGPSQSHAPLKRTDSAIKPSIKDLPSTSKEVSKRPQGFPRYARRSISRAKQLPYKGPYRHNTIPEEPELQIMSRHLSIEAALVRIFIADPKTFFKKFGHFLSNLPREPFYDACVAANIPFPQREFDRYQRMPRSLSISSMDIYAHKVTVSQTQKRLSLSPRQFAKHIPIEEWNQYRNQLLSEGGNATDVVDAEIGIKPLSFDNDDAPPCHSGTQVSVQIHSEAPDADNVSEDSV